MKKILFIIGAIILMGLNACDKKSCDCQGIIDTQLSYNINQNTLENCIIVENFTFKPDSTISIQRFYRDSEGDTNESTVDDIADWRLISTTPCVYKIDNLRGATYGFPIIENSCSNGFDTQNTFFYDLQFSADLKIEITNQTCDGATVNGVQMNCN